MDMGDEGCIQSSGGTAHLALAGSPEQANEVRMWVSSAGDFQPAGGAGSSEPGLLAGSPRAPWEFSFRFHHLELLPWKQSLAGTRILR